VQALLATWQSGGASQPAIGLGRLLAAAGHGVRILAPRSYAGRIAAAGCAHVPLPAAAEFDPSRGRAMEDQPAFFRETFHGQALPDALTAALADVPADVVVADYLLRSIIARAAEIAPRHALLVHTIYGFHRPTASDTTTAGLVAAAPLTIVPLPRAFDDWPDPPVSVVHTGPIPEAARTTPMAHPWRGGDRPLVVVTMGTTYMHQEALLAAVARAAAGNGARVLVLTGEELAPDELSELSDVEVAGFVSHEEVFPDAALVVCHGGVGTVVAAAAAGVPALCLPLGRDQALNARRLAELGAGIVTARDASADELAVAVGGALRNDRLRQGARRLAPQMGSDPTLAVQALERLVRDS
jgi:UDP:flavonoid glycosyltransferase YjiC (YdhE family)